MLFSTVAAMVVALATQPIAQAVTGRPDGARGFFVAACLFAGVATLVLPVVFLTTREQVTAAVPGRDGASRAYWRAVLQNRAFWSLIIGGGFMITCMTALGKSVLYYFKYYLHDEAGARTALALASGCGLAIVPFWMLVARRFSKRGIWLASCAIYAVGLIGFALADLRVAWQMNIFLIYMQVATVGLSFAYWGILPDTIEYGEWKTGVRAEAFVFGLALLFQKVALGLGAGVFGLALAAVGFRANQIQSAETLHGLKFIMVAVPLLGVSVCAVAMLFNPLKRGVHEKIVMDLSRAET
jgi:GPH family glycoside/pentoside/hexuronide:cation symporter